MTLKTKFRESVEEFLAASGMDPTRFGRTVMSDPNFVFDLRNNRSPTATTMDKVRLWISKQSEHEANNSRLEGTIPELSHRHLLAIQDMSPKEITTYLELADSYVVQNRKKIKKSSLLRGKTVINLFF